MSAAMWKQRIQSARLIAEKFYVSVNLMILGALSIVAHAQNADDAQGHGDDMSFGLSTPLVVPADWNADDIVQVSSPSFLTSAGIDQLTQCRAFASRKLDGGMDIEQMMGDEALAACEPVARILAFQPEVQYLYGRSLEATGREDEALTFYKVASDLGSGKADAALGRVYLKSDIEAKEALAEASFGLGYERGDTIAAFRLYELLRHERPSEASKLLAYARHQEYVPAIVESARLLMISPGNTTLSEAETEALLLKAANAGDTRSMGYLGRKWVFLPESDERRQWAVSFLRQAAANMDQEAASTLGLLMLTGDVEQRPQDNPRAMLEQAAESGNPKVKAALATIIIKEDGMMSDATRVVSLLSEAAADGDAGSASNLGTFYRTGLFVEQDMSLAARWYLIGLALGSEEFSEQIYGYVQWDTRGRDGLVYALKSYLVSLDLFESSPIDDIPDSSLARAVSRYITEIDVGLEARKLLR